jgi:hypothetical protein
MKRTFMTALVLSTLAGMSLPAVPAVAQMTPAQMPRTQMICGKRTDIARQLGEKYGETRRSLGVSGGQGVVELYASDETGSWTILITSPQGAACMMAAGQAFQIEPAVVAGSPT